MRRQRQPDLRPDGGVCERLRLDNRAEHGTRHRVDNINETTYTDIPDVAFRYSSAIWIFNMATNNLTKGSTYTFHINLKDGSYISFTFGTK